MKPYYQDSAVTIYQGDCQEILPTLNQVDLVFTSPPYNLGNFAKGSFYDGKSKGQRLEYISHDDSMSENEYIDWQHDLWNLWWSLLCDSGAIFYNHKPRVEGGVWNDRKNLVPYPIRQEIVWDRCCMVNFCGSFFASSSERIFIVCKDGWKPNQESVGFGEVWRIPPETNTPHPAPFPLKLAKMAIAGGCKSGGIVLDPFSGSGTSLRAAKDLNRKAIGIEIEEKYCEIAANRMCQEVLELKP